jgi:hypothetical protein
MAIAIAARAAAGLPAGESERQRDEHVRQFFTKELECPTPVYRGWARLYLNKDLKEANADIRAAYAGILKETGKGVAEMTPEIAGDEGVKWQMRNWVRVYFEFGPGKGPQNGRLEPETLRLIENLFWNYVCNRSHLARASGPATDIYGTENHEMMHYGNVLMALQALKNLPGYRDRKLPEDGRSVREHFEAWNAYYKEHFVARARYGDQIELFAAYWNYTMPEIFNMRDLSEDPLLRKRADMFLDVLWTDWAIGQLNGARGGCRTRIYQDVKDPSGGEASRGSADHWLKMSRILRDRDNWWKAQVHPHPIQGNPRVLAMTGYRFPDPVEELVADARARGEYVFVARRMGKQRAMPKEASLILKANNPWVPFDVTDTRMLSYEYCTPDYVVGSLIIDPLLKGANSQPTLRDLDEGYPALTSQNRYHAIQFATGVDARVVPQCLGLKDGKTYNQQQAIQHKNIQIVQRNKNGKQTGPMRVYFSKGMKGRLQERDGWFFLEEGNAFLAVKAFSAADASACPASWDNEFWLRPQDPDAPVVFVAGRKPKFGTLEDFMAYVGKLAVRAEGNRFTVAGADTDGEPCALTLLTDLSGIPEVNGKPISFTPVKLCDSPYLESEYGSGIVTIKKGARQRVLDFSHTNGGVR